MSLVWDLPAETGWDFFTLLLLHAWADAGERVPTPGRATQRLLLDTRPLFATRGTHHMSPRCLVAPPRLEDPTTQLSKAPSRSTGSLLPTRIAIGDMRFFSFKMTEAVVRGTSVLFHHGGSGLQCRYSSGLPTPASILPSPDKTANASSLAWRQLGVCRRRHSPSFKGI